MTTTTRIQDAAKLTAILLFLIGMVIFTITKIHFFIV